ncbi:hypothetical protein [Alkalitalea saponilacus]|uniref:Uncharacterized protein n=2 Tax=Alkalitalea saponilacus TaxID=889453 RepID=A0A1T5HTP7_9BACT|nr:hypothetical protein [Alkalitalea saponilacus]ASB49980.1 hypothetical protein CDL62_12960 [Alkalitalea saponilacus]SKC24065.1 hypothetical protein SAMN03080601_03357 [Alkalitalea saponilacus]
MQSLINWVSQHDNKRLFIVLYIGLSLVLSITISLFWLLFAVLIHFMFELIRQNQIYKKPKHIFLESLWETKLDFALVVFALWLAIYLDFIFGIAGVGALARVGVQSASHSGSVAAKGAEISVRFATWNRAIRGILLSLDDAGNAAKAIYQSKSSKKDSYESGYDANVINSNSDENTKVSTSWRNKWNVIDYMAVCLFLLTFVLIVLAPFILNISFAGIISVAMEEFHPLP